MNIMKNFINTVQRDLDTKQNDKFTAEMLGLTLGELVEKNPVVTIDADGKALSYFNDEVWDFYHYKHIDTNRDLATYKVTFTKDGLSDFALIQNKIAQAKSKIQH